MKIIVQNKKAFFDYDILQRYEAGIVLNGDEVKSIKAGHVSLLGCFGWVQETELFLLNCKVVPYEKSFQKNDEAASRRRKLLLHKREISKIAGEISRKGVTLVALKIYLSKGLIKVELGLAKHKKAAGKKEALKERDIKKDTARSLKGIFNYK